MTPGPTSYEVVLGPAARTLIRDLDRDEKRQFAEWLRADLQDAPSRDVITLDLLSDTYFAQAVGDYVVVYRPMTDDELVRLHRQRGEQGSPPTRGFIVFDLVPALPSHADPD